MMDKEYNENTIWNLIPEFFYDIISRIPPGILMIFLSYEFIFTKSVNDKMINFGFSELFLLILFGYALGLILSTLGEQIGKLYYKYVWRNCYELDNGILKKFFKKHQVKNIDVANYKELKTKDWLQIHRHMHDYAKNYNKQAGKLLPKLHAESLIANNLAVVIICFMLMLTIKHFHSGNINHYWILIIVLSLFSIGLIFIGKERYSNLIERQFSYIKIILETK
jgi:hypothetical protein